MRIAIVGSACQGKTTLVNDIIKTWPAYKAHESGYRKVVKEKNLLINKETNKETQETILKCLVDDLKNYSAGEKIIFDRCPLDNIVYSLWAEEKKTSDIDSEFIKECIPLVQESMHNLDIIFYIPITKAASVIPIPRENREVDYNFINEIDNIFKALSHQYYRTGHSPFFPKEDRPPIIEIFGTPEERIEMIRLYLDDHGDLVNDEKSVLNPENMDLIERLLTDQQDAKISEEEWEKFKSNIILPPK
jgi:AAA domain